MTDWDDSQDGDGIKKLRKMVREQGEKLAQFEAREAEWSLKNRDADINQALADRGLNPRVAKFYPKDAGTDAQSVDAWVEENKELFGDRRVIDEGNVDSNVLTDSEQRGYQTLQDISNYENSVHMDFKSKIDKVEFDPMDPIGSQEKLMAAIEDAARYL